jgi:hypothetical protein
VIPEVIASPGDKLTLGLEWRVTGQPDRDYTIFVHLVGPFNPDLNSPIWAQDDDRPGGGSFPTTRWRAGQTILEEYSLEVPPGAPAGEYTIQVGMYWLPTGERVPLAAPDGSRLPDDSLTIAAIELE